MARRTSRPRAEARGSPDKRGSAHPRAVVSEECVAKNKRSTQSEDLAFWRGVWRSRFLGLDTSVVRPFGVADAYRAD